MTISSYVWKTSAVAGMFLSMAGAFANSGTHVSAQQPQKSVGRGWPVTMTPAYSGYPEDSLVGAVTPWYYTSNPTATGGKAPAGVQPWPRDIFTSKDFRVDRDLWVDKRYYRCNSPSRSTRAGAILRAVPDRRQRSGDCRGYIANATMPVTRSSALSVHDRAGALRCAAETRSHGGLTTTRRPPCQLVAVTPRA
jgi:hypothetical protein